MKWFSYLIKGKKALLICVMFAALIAIPNIGCSSTQTLKSYSPEQAIAKRDVVDVHGQATNVEKLENFIDCG